LTSAYVDAIKKTCQDHGKLNLKVLCIRFFHGETNRRIYFGTVGVADRLKSRFLPDFKKSPPGTASTDNAA